MTKAHFIESAHVAQLSYDPKGVVRSAIYQRMEVLNDIGLIRTVELVVGRYGGN